MKPVAFDREGARLIVKATREALRRPRGRVAKPAGARLLQPIMVMFVTVQVEVATSAGPGKGKGRYCPVLYDDNDVATYGDPYGDEYPLYSIDPTSPTPAGKKVVIGNLNGRPVVIVEVCP